MKKSIAFQVFTALLTLITSVVGAFNSSNDFLGQGDETQTQILEEEELKTIKIAFGDKLTTWMLGASNLHDTQWSIIKEEEQTAKGIGASLLDVTFDIPGTYRIEVSLNNEEDAHQHEDLSEMHRCGGYHGAKEFVVEVSPFKVVYHCEAIQFTKQITGSIDTKGIVMKVPVEIVYYNGGNSEQILIPSEVMSAGIKTSIKGKLVANQRVPLSVGLHILHYELSGSGTSDTYISFDFTDHNGMVVPCGLDTPL